VGTNVVQDLSAAMWPVFWASLTCIVMVLIAASLMGFIAHLAVKKARPEDLPASRNGRVTAGMFPRSRLSAAHLPEHGQRVRANRGSCQRQQMLDAQGVTATSPRVLGQIECSCRIPYP
jgi:hypothetical protein